MRWPPPPTRRNRVGARTLAVLLVVAGAYVLTVALVSHALVPWLAFAVCVAALLVVVVAIGLMHLDGGDGSDDDTAGGRAETPDRADTARDDG